MAMRVFSVLSEFAWRRILSFTGIWVLCFLVVHLVTNSLAAYWLSDEGKGFMRAVNFLENLPYLKAIEITLIALPLAVHVILGIRRMWTACYNSFPNDYSRPFLPYGRNHAFTWQRLTALIILVGLVFHVIQMRFISAPKEVHVDHTTFYVVKIHSHAQLASTADQLQVVLFSHDTASNITPQEAFLWEKALRRFTVKDNQVLAAAKEPGSVFLLVVRDTFFHNPPMMIVYGIFVLATVFHACNGAWTFLITWGIALSERSQKVFLFWGVIIMLILGFLGLSAIIGSSLLR